MQDEKKDRESKVVEITTKSRVTMSKKKRILITIIGAAVYILLNITLVRVSLTQEQYIELFYTQVHTSNLRAILSQLQMLVCVCIVLLQGRVGYYTDLTLLLFSLAGASLSTIGLKNNDSIEGVIVSISTLIVVIILYRYIRISDTRMREVHEQKEEMLALYEEIAASEETLLDQNGQLEEYNKTLEEREEELNQLAFYDPLTGLPNRRMVINRLDVLLQIAKQDKREFSVLFVDLDNFKKINDSAGHQVGDEILQVISKRWKRLVHPTDLLGRLGGDEFAVVIQRSMDVEDIYEYVDTLRKALNERVYFQAREFFVKASFGVSMYPRDGEDSDRLLKCADMAMYEAKASRTNEIKFFDSNMQVKLLNNIKIENNLQQALQKGELALVYQPQYDCKNHKLRGFETLIRWNSGKLGLVMPNEFIPIAEESGMIIIMGAWILETACRTCRDWMNTYHQRFILSVNISVVQLMDASFVSMVQRVLEETGFDPHNLEIEVTESMFISSMDFAVNVLEEIRQLGIKIALDDFGTGYASLSYLQTLPIDIIKLDKAFIDTIVSEKRQKALVDALIKVAHELNFTVIAEGVEEENQLDILKTLDCDFIQGYLWGKPVSAELAKEKVEKEM